MILTELPLNGLTSMRRTCNCVVKISLGYRQSRKMCNRVRVACTVLVRSACSGGCRDHRFRMLSNAGGPTPHIDTDCLIVSNRDDLTPPASDTSGHCYCFILPFLWCASQVRFLLRSLAHEAFRNFPLFEQPRFCCYIRGNFSRYRSDRVE